MTQISIAEAAKRTGKSKTTIWRAVKSGHVSATQDATAQYQIDEAEIARAFPYETIGDAAMKLREAALAPHETGDAAVLTAKLDGAEGIIAELRARIGDLIGERDSLRDQNTRLTTLLAPPTPATIPAKKDRSLLGLLSIVAVIAIAIAVATFNYERLPTL